MDGTTEHIHTATSASKSMLAQRYHVSVRTLMEWLRASGHTTFGGRRMLQPREVAEVYQVLGPPEKPVRFGVMSV
jgi:hypothetical protein